MMPEEQGLQEHPLPATVHTIQQWTAKLANSRITHLSLHTIFLAVSLFKILKDKRLFLNF